MRGAASLDSWSLFPQKLCKDRSGVASKRVKKWEQPPIIEVAWHDNSLPQPPCGECRITEEQPPPVYGGDPSTDPKTEKMLILKLRNSYGFPGYMDKTWSSVMSALIYNCTEIHLEYLTYNECFSHLRFIKAISHTDANRVKHCQHLYIYKT